MRLLIIDNYDSFTFNLKHICQKYVLSVDVIRNDIIDMESIYQYDKIIISPGPGLPQNAGCCLDFLKLFLDKKPILGVCLGAQAIAMACGSELFNLSYVMHGKKSEIEILDMQDPIYREIPKKITVGRYHSWAINIKSNELLITTARDQENVVMSFRHREYPVFGIQYHPESILTKYGDSILKNWLLG